MRLLPTAEPQEWVTPQKVLILFNLSWPDEDGNHGSDSQDVAECHAARRGIPKEHLLGRVVTDHESKPDRLTCPEFFRPDAVCVWRSRGSGIQVLGARPKR